MINQFFISQHVKYYPTFIPYGTSLWNAPNYPVRDFYYSEDGWLEHFGRRFVFDYYNTMIREQYTK